MHDDAYDKIVDADHNLAKTEGVKSAIRVRDARHAMERCSRMNKVIQISQEHTRNTYAPEEYMGSRKRFLSVVPDIDVGLVCVMLNSHTLRQSVKKMGHLGIDGDHVMALASQQYQKFKSTPNDAFHTKNKEHFYHSLAYPSKDTAIKFCYPTLGGDVYEDRPPALQGLQKLSLEYWLDKNPLPAESTPNSEYADLDDYLGSDRSRVSNSALAWATEFH